MLKFGSTKRNEFRQADEAKGLLESSRVLADSVDHHHRRANDCGARIGALESISEQKAAKQGRAFGGFRASADLQ